MWGNQEGSWCTRALRRELVDPSALLLEKESKGYANFVIFDIFLFFSF